MGKLSVSTQMTLDGVIDVGEWYVADGEHGRAGTSLPQRSSTNSDPGFILPYRAQENAHCRARDRIGCDSWVQRSSIRA